MPNYNPLIQDNTRQQYLSKAWLNKQTNDGGGSYILTLRATTTNATATFLTIDGISSGTVQATAEGAAGIPVPQNGCLSAILHYAAWNATDNVGTSYVQTFMLTNVAGTTAALVSGTLNAGTIAGGGTGVVRLGSTTSTITLAANDTNDTMSVSVVGTAAKTIYHVAVIECIWVTDPEKLASEI